MCSTPSHGAIAPIGTIATPFRQKFAIPRQPNLVNAKGIITLTPEISSPSVFKGLEHFSHVWLLFWFHETAGRGWKPAVKAPRLGGNATLGVFASRSTHRPNPIGMSVVRNLGWQQTGATLSLQVEGVDLVDGTPILDIKPYVPYADKCDAASDTLTAAYPSQPRAVSFSPAAREQMKQIEMRHSDFCALLSGILEQDPRPAYRQKLDDDERLYHVALYDRDAHWRVRGGSIVVEHITGLSE